MKRTMKISTLILLLPFFLWSCKHQSFSQKVDIPNQEGSLSEKIDSIIINKMNQYGLSGVAVGVVQHDSIIYNRGFGVRSIKTNKSVTENTVFHTASVSKLFTAIAIVQLIQKGHFSLESKLVQLIPELSFSDERVEQITIKQILNHTSGLPDVRNYHWENNHQADNSLKNYMLGLNLKLEFDPSTSYAYSNLGYNILGYVVEKASGLSFEEYTKTNVLEPSKMINSDFRYYKISDSLRTVPHTKNRITGAIQEREIYPYTREHAASSTLNASVSDLSNWMSCFLKSLDDLDSNYDYKEMLISSSKTSSNIGLGFQLYDFESKKAVGHYGGDRGFRSFLMMIPEEKMGLVILGNCDYDDDFRHEILHPVAQLMLSKKKE